MPNLDNNQSVKKHVELWQLVIAILAVVVSVITFTSMMTASVRDESAKNAALTENHELRLKQLEFDRTEIKQDIKDMKSDIRETLLILRDKADRK